MASEDQKNNIEVAVAVTGSDQAVAEAKKVEQAIEKMPISINPAADAFDKVTDAIDNIPKATSKAADALDDIPKSINSVSDALKEEGDEFAQAGEEARKHSEQLAEISKASRTLVAIQTVEMLKKTTAALRDATKEGGLLHDQLGDLGPALDTVDNGLNMMSAGLGTAVATGNPLIGVLAGVAAGVGGVANAYQEMRNSEAAAANSEKYAQEMKLKLLETEEFRKRNLSLITQVDGITAENEALSVQENALLRMIELREKLAGQANTAAKQEVQLAKLKGGDVALAEANVIATEMAGGLRTLNDKLAAAKQEASVATTQEISASKAWQLAQREVAAGLRDLWDADTQDIKAAAEAASKEGEQAREKLTGFMAVYENSRLEILRSAEIALETKEREYSGKATKAAEAAFNNVYRSLGDELAKGPPQMTDAIAQIQADVATVTAAATGKAGEVSAAMSTASSEVVKSVQQIGTSAQQSAAATDAAVTAVGNQVTEALNLMTDKVITVLAKVAANGIDNASKIAAQDARINQLFARQR